MAASRGQTQMTLPEHRNSSSCDKLPLQSCILSFSLNSFSSTLMFWNAMRSERWASLGLPQMSQTLPVSSLSASQTVVKTSTGLWGSTPGQVWPAAQQLSLKSKTGSTLSAASSVPVHTWILPHKCVWLKPDHCLYCQFHNTEIWKMQKFELLVALWWCLVEHHITPVKLILKSWWKEQFNG